MSLTIQKKIPLHSFTTLRVGGSAAYFTIVTDVAELKQAVDFAMQNQLPFCVLGGGSNVLVSEDGFKGVVIKIAIRGYSVVQKDTQVFVTVCAGEILDDIIAHTVAHGWWGLENLSHIPGTIGAAPVQNIGAYGVEIKDLIESVHVLNTDSGCEEIFSNDMCAFTYRDSVFKSPEGKKYIITAVTVRLSQDASPKISYADLTRHFTDEVFPTQSEIRNVVIAIRSRKFPNWREVGTAGSFFKNPIVSNEQYQSLRARYLDMPGYAHSDTTVKIPLGWILDKVLHLRGYTEGYVSTYTEQALVLVAYKGATSRAIELFANKIVTKIKNEVGIDVEWEVTLIK